MRDPSGCGERERTHRRGRERARQRRCAGVVARPAVSTRGSRADELEERLELAERVVHGVARRRRPYGLTCSVSVMVNTTLSPSRASTLIGAPGSVLANQ